MRFQFSPSGQSVLYFFIFLSGSYLSFFLASKTFTSTHGNRTFELRLLLSLIYAINPYTLYAFTYTWGYSPFLALYPLIPLIFGLTYFYFRNGRVISKSLMGLGVVFFLSNIAFGNFSFFVSLFFFLILFFALILILKFDCKKLFYKMVAYLSIFFGVTLWTVLPRHQWIYVYILCNDVKYCDRR